MTCFEAALSYAQRGWPVFAVHTPTKNGCSCGKKDCDNIGKHPRWHEDDLAHGVHSATADGRIIRRWWERCPDANVGLITGEQTFDVLDVDLRINVNGSETLDALESKHSRLPSTVVSLTGGGGQQYFFVASGKIKNSVGFAPGLDTRSTGGYVVVPPSLHKSGKRYEWELSSEPGDVPLAAMPSWLIKIIQDAGGGNSNGSGLENGNPKGWELPLLKGVEEGQRDATAAKLAGKYISQGLRPIEVYFLLCGWDARNKPPLGEREISKKVKSIAQIHERNQTGDRESELRKRIKVSFD